MTVGKLGHGGALAAGDDEGVDAGQLLRLPNLPTPAFLFSSDLKLIIDQEKNKPLIRERVAKKKKKTRLFKFFFFGGGIKMEPQKNR